MARISSFEKFPQAYEAWFDVHKLVYQDEVKTAKALVGNHTNGLEIGIGSGKFALPMGIEVGIEPSGQMRKIAQSKGLSVIDAVAEDLPFEAETFDYAAMITVVCLVDDLPKALEEAYREKGEVITITNSLCLSSYNTNANHLHYASR
jgi:ubiquinone/menaquinone biosynthesis C-methylase UbiE